MLVMMILTGCHTVFGTMYLAHYFWHTVFGTLFLAESVFADLCVRVIADSERSWDGRSKVTVMVEFETRII